MSFSTASGGSSIFHDVSFKDAPVLAPTIVIEFSFGVETFGGRIGHIQSVMRIVMREESLAAEAEQTVYLAQPLIQLIETGFVTLLVDGIRLAQAASRYLQRASWRRKACGRQGIAQ